MRALLTGSTGYLGSRTFRALVALKAGVRVLVRPSSLANDARSGFLKDQPNVDIVPGDFDDPLTLEQAVRDQDVVYHLAWNSLDRSLPGSEISPGINLRGTEALLAASCRAGVRRFVFCSSVAVYGYRNPVELWPLGEETPINPMGAYAMAKAQAEAAVQDFHARNGMEVVIVRPCIVYGPGASEVERMLLQMLLQPQSALAHDRGRPRHMVHVRDAAAATVLAGLRDKAAGHAINIAGPDSAIARDLVRILHKAAGRQPSRWTASPQGTTEERPLNFDISKSIALLRYRPGIAIQKGVEDMLPSILSRFQRGEIDITQPVQSAW